MLKDTKLLSVRTKRAEERGAGYNRFHQPEDRGLAANEEAVLTAGTWGNTLSCSPQPGTGKVYCIPAFGNGKET